MFNRIFAFLFLLLLCNLNIAQTQLNFGLVSPQKQDVLPKTKAGFQKSTPKTKETVKTEIKSLGYNQYELTSGWELADSKQIISSSNNLFDNQLDTRKWYNATVPGTVLQTLVNQGVCPDPYYGLNNLAIPDSLCRTDWWYRIAFDLPAKEINKACKLIFNGINYKAEIWLNGQYLGKMDGAFVKGVFEVGKVLHKHDKNILAVRILPPPNPGIPHEETKFEIGPNGGQLCLDGPTFIASEGWDWMPGIRDRNIGIWQNVVLQFHSGILIEDARIVSQLNLPDTTQAKLNIYATVVNETNNEQIVTVTGEIEKIRFSKQINLAANEKKNLAFLPEDFSQLNIKNPRLWWPNGYGKPNLYNLNMSVSYNDIVEPIKPVRFGIRQFSYGLMVQFNHKNVRIEYSPLDLKQKNIPLFDFTNRKEYEKNKDVEIGSLYDGVLPENFNIVESDNPFLVIKVNGKSIFCKGGNWGMDDAMKNVSRSKLEPFIKLHQKANFNMIRNWTGESTEEVFYDLCDEYGILVWNDFQMSTEGLNLPPLNEPLFLSNVTDIVKRFRNHACIAIWCPRNEGYAPVSLGKEIQKIIAKEDDTRHYHGNSRRMNMPWSGPWHFFSQPSEYFTKTAQGFNSELGTLSVPTAETIRKFIAPEDSWPIGDVWYYHDLHFLAHGWDAYLRDIDRLGNVPAQNLESFCNRAQILNYNSHRAMFEAWNSKMWNTTSGVLMWMSHPAWPSVIWQSYSYDYETFGSYFGCKKACEPIHIQWNNNSDTVAVVNASLRELKTCTIELNYFEKNGKLLNSVQIKTDAPANKTTSIRLPELKSLLPEITLLRLKLKQKSGGVLSENEYWLNAHHKENLFSLGGLDSAMIDVKVICAKRMPSTLLLSVNLRNKAKIAATYLKTNVLDSNKKEGLLPVYVSDNYFTLLPNENKTIEMEVPLTAIENKDIAVSVYGFNVPKVISTNIKY